MLITEKQILQLISIANTALHSDAFANEALKEIRILLNNIVDQQSDKLKEIKD